jgi:hypothetical protein
MTNHESRSQLRRIAAMKGEAAPEFENAAAQEHPDVSISASLLAAGNPLASAASPLDYPGIPADLARQIREDRRELVEALSAIKHIVMGIDAQAKRVTRSEAGEDIIVHYQLNTGLWHRLLGLLSGVSELGSPAHIILREIIDWNAFHGYPEHTQNRVMEFVRTGKDPLHPLCIDAILAKEESCQK